MTSIARPVLLASLLSLTALAACKPGEPSAVPGEAKPSGRHERGAAVEVTGEPIVFASVGVPHGAAISLIAVDPLGQGALSRDTGGGVRLWPALDGSREPLVVPVRDPRAMALAGDGAGGWVLALLDAAGGARIVGVDEAGEMQPLASLPPTDPLLDLAVLPGGERLIAIGSDHVIRLLDRQGKQLARLDRPGLRPASLRIATAAKAAAEAEARIVALTAGEFDSSQGRFAVEVLPLEIGDDKLSLTAAGRQTIHLDSPPSQDNPSLAPDGRTIVFLQRQRLGGATWKVVAMQLEDGRQVSVDSQTTNGVQPRFGLMNIGRVLIDDGTGLGRIVDLAERKSELSALRSSPTINHLGSAFAAGLRLAPASNWLVVHELETDDLRYLGYRQINVTDAGVSPSGRIVAWALDDRVAVERLGSGDGDGDDGGDDGAGTIVEIPGTRAQATRFVDFLDEDLVLTLDWAGGAQLLRWRDGEVVSAVDVGNNVQTADFARDGHGGGVMFVRTNLWQNPTVVELRDHEIGARYLTHATANLAGILSSSDEPIDSWGGWTIDGAGKLHRYTLAQLRAGLDVESALEGGEALPAPPEQFAIGPDGARYWVRTTGTRPTLYIEDGEATEEIALPTGFVVLLTPSRDGRRVAVVQQRDPGQVITVYERATGQPAWAQPLPVVNGMSWSDASEALAVPATLGGGVVLDGDDGTPLVARCGLGFEVRRTPPVIQGFFNQLSVCDL